jgi:hypothetical protein
MTSTRPYGSVLAISLVLLAACAQSEATDRPTGSTSGAPMSFTLPAGTLVDATLNDVISSRHASAGDVFTAGVVKDVTIAGGWIAIPAGSTVRGTITEVSPAPNAGATGTLTLAVSSVTVRGKSYDFAASIDSLATTREGRGIEGMDAARVGVGAAAGAILGRVIGGNSTGTIVGGVVGGVTGAVVSAAIKDVDIVLPAGTHLMLTVTQRLTVAAK